MSTVSAARPELVIYGLRCICHRSEGVRYVGKASTSFAGRFDVHKISARKGLLTPVYVWMREHGIENVYAEVLIFAENVERLDFLEKARIQYGFAEGELLLNVKGGRSGIVAVAKPRVSNEVLGLVEKGLARGFGCKEISDGLGVDEMLVHDLAKRFSGSKPVITRGTALKFQC